MNLNFSELSLEEEQQFNKKLSIIYQNLFNDFEQIGFLRNNQENFQINEILKESFIQLEFGLKQNQIQKIEYELVCQEQSKNIEAFLVQVVRNFFMYLTTDQMGILCQNYIQRFVYNLKKKIREKKEIDIQDQSKFNYSDDEQQTNDQKIVFKNDLAFDQLNSSKEIIQKLNADSQQHDRVIEFTSQDNISPYQADKNLNQNEPSLQGNIKTFKQNISQDVPRYMAQTLSQNKKLQSKSNKKKEISDFNQFSNDLRKQTNEEDKKMHKKVWKPQNCNFLIEGFSKIKPAPKLEKILQKKFESPKKIDENHKKTLFERLYNEGSKEIKRLNGQNQNQQNQNQKDNNKSTDKDPIRGNLKNTTQDFVLSLRNFEDNVHRQSPKQTKKNSIKSDQNFIQIYMNEYSDENREQSQNEINQTLLQTQSKIIAYQKEQKSSQKKQQNLQSTRSKKDLFEHLQTSGLKNIKIQKLQEIKLQKELEECSFHPQILSKSNTQQKSLKSSELNVHTYRNVKMDEIIKLNNHSDNFFDGESNIFDKTKYSFQELQARKSLQRDFSNQSLLANNLRSNSRKSDYTQKINIFYNNFMIGQQKPQQNGSRNEIRQLKTKQDKERNSKIKSQPYLHKFKSKSNRYQTYTYTQQNFKESQIPNNQQQIQQIQEACSQNTNSYEQRQNFVSLNTERQQDYQTTEGNPQTVRFQMTLDMQSQIRSDQQLNQNIDSLRIQENFNEDQDFDHREITQQNFNEQSKNEHRISSSVINELIQQDNVASLSISVQERKSRKDRKSIKIQHQNQQQE